MILLYVINITFNLIVLKIVDMMKTISCFHSVVGGRGHSKGGNSPDSFGW